MYTFEMYFYANLSVGYSLLNDNTGVKTNGLYTGSKVSVITMGIIASRCMGDPLAGTGVFALGRFGICD
jgi:hypothetical protein